MAERTESEILFETVCASLGVPCIRVPEEATPTPDYQIELAGNIVFAEVKQFEENEDDRRAMNDARLRGSSAAFPKSDERIRRRIYEANKQLKQRTDDRHPGVLVLWSNTLMGDYDAQDIHDAMFGSETHTFAIPARGIGGPVYLGPSLARDGKMTPGQHTSTSAIISLRSSPDGKITLTFYHNRFAKVPIDANWLRADTVAHFASEIPDGKGIPVWVQT